MAKGDVIVRDLGLNYFKRQLQKADNVAVVVGVQKYDDNTETGQFIAEYAAYNEFGTSRIPERSFMRSTFDENINSLLQTMANEYDAVKRGERTVLKALRVMGELHQSQIQTKIRNLKTPPNAEATIAKKGTDNPLIESGSMVNNIRYVIRPK